jgi:hypothetical protein
MAIVKSAVTLAMAWPLGYDAHAYCPRISHSPGLGRSKKALSSGFIVNAPTCMTTRCSASIERPLRRSRIAAPRMIGSSVMFVPNQGRTRRSQSITRGIPNAFTASRTSCSHANPSSQFPALRSAMANPIPAPIARR